MISTRESRDPSHILRVSHLVAEVSDLAADPTQSREYVQEEVERGHGFNPGGQRSRIMASIGSFSTVDRERVTVNGSMVVGS